MTGRLRSYALSWRKEVRPPEVYRIPANTTIHYAAEIENTGDVKKQIGLSLFDFFRDREDVFDVAEIGAKETVQFEGAFPSADKNVLQALFFSAWTFDEAKQLWTRTHTSTDLWYLMNSSTPISKPAVAASLLPVTGGALYFAGGLLNGLKIRMPL